MSSIHRDSHDLYSLYSELLKGGYIGDYYRKVDIKADTRSLDYSSYVYVPVTGFRV